MTSAFIGMGSNLQHPEQQLRAAATALSELPHSRLVACSPVYRSAAVGPGEQADYLNAVAQLHTDLAPLALLDALQHIELQQGRERHERWGARSLDLDILLYGQHQLTLPGLQVPHPAMADRNFVLQPLSDLMGSTMKLPDGTVLAKLLQSCPPGELVRTAITLDGHHQQ